MKRLLTGLIVSGLIFGCAGCAKIGEGSEEEPVATVDIEETGETYEIGDVLTTPSGEFCVHKVYSFDIDETASAELANIWGKAVPEGQYIVVDVSYTNLLTEDKEVSQENFEVYLDNDQIFCPKYEPYFNSFVLEGQMFQERTLHPGRTERGYIIYRYYRDASEFEFVCDGVSVKENVSKVGLIPLITPTPTPEPVEVTETTAAPTETTAAPQPTETQPVETTAAPVETQPSNPEETQPTEAPAEEAQPAE